MKQFLYLYTTFLFIANVITVYASSDTTTLRKLESRIWDLKAKNWELDKAISATDLSIYDANNTIFKLNNNIDKVKRNIPELRTSLFNVHQDITNLGRKRKNAELSAANLSQEWTDIEKEKNKIKVQIGELIQENYILAKKVDVVDARITKLNSIAPKTSGVIISLHQMLVNTNEINNHFNQINEMHNGWVSRLKETLKAHQPEYTQINSIETYKIQYIKILNLTKNIPEQGSLDEAEKNLIIKLKKSYKEIAAVQMSIRDVVTSPELGVITHFKILTPELRQLREVDLDLDKYKGEIARMEYTIKELSAKRNYLVQVIPNTWKVLTNAMLSKLNIKGAHQLINDIEIELKGAEIYSAIRGDLERIDTQARNGLYKYFAPYYSRRMALSGTQYIKNINEKIIKQNLSSASFVAQVNALTTDYARNFQEMFAQAHYASCKELSRYSNEIRRQMNLLAKRFESNGTAMMPKDSDKTFEECKLLAQTVLKEQSQTRLEYFFIDFRKGCVK
ncbi:MAG: hypothetical protein HQK53_02250 [Oligoflexia bacterium]|nr:hypothetical protein [Oligoflexia bacterium]